MDTQTSSDLHATRNDLPIESRTAMVALLNQHLADLFDLFSQIKQAHWNVKGMGFIALHKLFDDLAADIIVFVDDVAERATALGGTAAGTARMAAANSRLVEFPEDVLQDQQVVEALVTRYADYGTLVRIAIEAAEDAGDLSTQDLFIEISREIDKHLYFLEAHLQAG